MGYCTEFRARDHMSTECVDVQPSYYIHALRKRQNSESLMGARSSRMGICSHCVLFFFPQAEF